MTVRGLVMACGVAVTAAIACFAVISVVSGYGLGWVTQVSASAPIVSWMSLPTAAAMLTRVATGRAHGATTLDHEMEAFRRTG